MPDDFTNPSALVFADKIADKTAQKVFSILGVDIENPREIEDFRRDLRFSRSMREIVRSSLFAAGSALGLTLIGVIGLGILSKIKDFI